MDSVMRPFLLCAIADYLIEHEEPADSGRQSR
jgi:hypothetical protein